MCKTNALACELPRELYQGYGNIWSMNEGCAQVWSALSATQSTLWLELKKKWGGPERELNRQLFTLEVMGWIRRLPGRTYLRG